MLENRITNACSRTCKPLMRGVKWTLALLVPTQLGDVNHRTTDPASVGLPLPGEAGASFPRDVLRTLYLWFQEGCRASITQVYLRFKIFWGIFACVGSMLSILLPFIKRFRWTLRYSRLPNSIKPPLCGGRLLFHLFSH